MLLHENTLTTYFAFLFPLVFILFWVFISFLISMLSGWHALAEDFPQQGEPYGQTRTAGPFFYTVYMRYWCHYSGVIRLTAANDALHLSVLGLFRVGHPPLRIPWHEIQIVVTRWKFHSFVLLTLGNQKCIPLRISERMAHKLGILDRIAGRTTDLQPHS